VRAVLTGALQESDGTTYEVATRTNPFVHYITVGRGVLVRLGDAQSGTQQVDDSRGSSAEPQAASALAAGFCLSV